MKAIGRLMTRLREVRHAAGGSGVLLIAPVWLIRRRHVVLAMELPDSEIQPSAKEVEIEWRQIHDGEHASILEMNPGLDPDLVTARFREGHTLYACLMNGRIVHSRWYASKRSWLPFLRLTWEPEEGDYTVFGAFTRPDERNRGVNVAVVRQGLERARRLGYRRVVSFIAEWNAPSLKATTRGGLRPVGPVTLWTLGFVQWHTTSGKARVEDGTLHVSRS